MIHYNSCPHCNFSGIEVEQECLDHFISGEAFSIMKCANCGFLFTQDPPDENEIALYYKSEAYISHSDTSKGLLNKLYRHARRLMLSRKYSLIKSILGSGTGQILDIGSGTGYFQAYLTRKGWSATGIEINSDAREYAKRTFSVESYSPDQLIRFHSSSFDFITMWHSLEHFHDPGYYLKSAQNILKDNGYLIIALPNHNSFDAEFYGKYWAAWDVPRHLWHFGPSSVKAFIERFGFTLRSVHRLPLDSFYVSLLSERYRKSVFPLIQGSLIGFVSWITSLLRKNRSSSLIYIFEKSHS